MKTIPRKPIETTSVINWMNESATAALDARAADTKVLSRLLVQDLSSKAFQRGISEARRANVVR